MASQESRRKQIGFNFPIKNLQHQENFGSGNWWPLADADFVVNLRVKPGSYLLIFENLPDLLSVVCKLNDFINYFIEGDFLYIVQKSTKKFLRFSFLDFCDRNLFLERAFGFLTQLKADEDDFENEPEKASKKIATERREKILKLKEEQKASLKIEEFESFAESSPIRARAATLETPKKSTPILKRQNSLGDINDNEKSNSLEIGENSSQRPIRISKDAALLRFENSPTTQNAALKETKKKKKDVFAEWKKEKVKKAKEINKEKLQKSQENKQAEKIPERNRDIYKLDDETELFLRKLEENIKNAAEWNDQKARNRQELVDQDFCEEETGPFGAARRTFWAKNLYRKELNGKWEQQNRPDRRVKMELQRIVRRIEFYVENTVEIFAGKTGKIDFVFHEKAVYLASEEDKTFLRLELDTDEDPNMLKRFLEVGNGLFNVHKMGQNGKEVSKKSVTGFLVTNVFKLERIKMREGRLTGSWDRIAAKNEPVEIRLHEKSIEFCVRTQEEHKFLINKKDECRFQRRSNALYLQNYDAKVAYRFEYKNGQEKLHDAFKQLLRRTYAPNDLFICKSRTNIPKPAPSKPLPQIDPKLKKTTEIEEKRPFPANLEKKVESRTIPKNEKFEIRPRAATLELIKPEKQALKRQKSLAELDKIGKNSSFVEKQPFRKRRNAEDSEIELSESAKIESRYPFTPIEANKIDTSKWNFQKSKIDNEKESPKESNEQEFQLRFDDDDDSQNREISREKFEEHRKEDRLRRKRTKMLRKEKQKLKKQSLSGGLEISTSEK